MNLTPINSKKIPKTVSFVSGNGYRFATGELSSLYDDDPERLYNASVTYGTAKEKNTVAGIHRKLTHRVNLWDVSRGNILDTISVAHGSKLSDSTLRAIAEYADEQLPLVRINSGERASLCVVKNEEIAYLITLGDNNVGNAVTKKIAQLKMYIDAIGASNIFSDEEVNIFPMAVSKIGVVFDDRALGGKLIYRVMNYNDSSTDDNRIKNLFTATPHPSGRLSVSYRGLCEDDVYVYDNRYSYVLFGGASTVIIPKYSTKIPVFDAHRESGSTPNDLVYNCNVSDASNTVNEVFAANANPNYTYIGQTYYDDELIPADTKLIDIDYSRIPLKTLYRVTGDSYSNYYTGTILIETDDQDYNTAGVASVKMSYGGGTTMQTIWSRGCGYAVSISDTGRIVYKGNTVSGSVDTNNLVISRSGGQRVMTDSNAWATSTAGNITFSDAYLSIAGWTVITEQGKCYIKVPDDLEEAGHVVDLFAEGAKRMIIPPAAWYGDKKSGSTKTRQWYYLRLTWNATGINSRATVKTSTATDYNKGNLAALAAKVFLIDNPDIEGGYKVFILRLTRVYTNKSLTSFSNVVFFTGIDDNAYTLTGMYPITAARQTGQSYTV